MRICHRWMQEKMTGRSHPPRCTTARDDRWIVRMAVWDRAATSRTIAPQIQSVTHHLVSASTIRPCLQQNVMSARCSLLRLPLTGNPRCLRHQWCD
ncbi:HTH_Tnp_Tc3_2 domain-containing protein [Trichonephila clavipes]|nr:HTH_Tnp_Tc3_2 domain-containing protein [Trichonephila clavipes]